MDKRRKDHTCGFKSNEELCCFWSFYNEQAQVLGIIGSRRKGFARSGVAAQSTKPFAFSFRINIAEQMKFENQHSIANGPSLSLPIFPFSSPRPSLPPPLSFVHAP